MLLGRSYSQVEYSALVKCGIRLCLKASDLIIVCLNHWVPSAFDSSLDVHQDQQICVHFHRVH